jgi:hypothetical protein
MSSKAVYRAVTITASQTARALVRRPEDLLVLPKLML